MISALVLAAALVASPLPQDPAPETPPGQTASLTLTFDVGATTGKIQVALFDSEAAYDGRGAPVAQGLVDVSAGQREAAFAGLTPGTYAAKIFHDVDGDGEMDTNPFGMPTEPYGFTNNARGNMGPARWDRAQVAVTGAVVQTISLK